MDVITLRYNGKTTQHNIYTRDEADKLGIRYVRWRRACVGEWALTDDGFVAQVLHIKVHVSDNGRLTILHTFAFWNIWNTHSAVVSYTRSIAIRRAREEVRLAIAAREGQRPGAVQQG